MKYWIPIISTFVLLAGCDGDSGKSEADGTFTTAQLDPPIKARENPEKDKSIKTLALSLPEDHVVEDRNAYSAAANASLPREAVDETPAVKNHQAMIDGKLIRYTASAGHLISYAPNKTVAQASLFYMAYTRQDLPKENRPVTFFWNGGPGNSYVWLQLGSWAPKQLKIFARDFSKSEKDGFSWIDNAETLLDKTDLVFVDPPGTGFSQAIAPYRNSDFWSVEADALLNHDFIVRFGDRFGRQRSPKFLFGDTFDGIRLPIVANLLVAGKSSTSGADKNGKKPVALSGLVLSSPMLDLRTNCGQSSDASCAGYLPSYAMVADFHGKTTSRGAASAQEYIDKLRIFVAETYDPARKIWYSPELTRAKAVLAEAVSQYGHMTSLWSNAASARQWALNVETRPNAIDEATKLARVLLADDAERVRFVLGFLADPLDALKQFVADAKQQVETALTPAWRDFAQTQAGTALFKDMTSITGLDADWLRELDISPIQFRDRLFPRDNLDLLDARLTGSSPWIPAAELDSSPQFADAIRTVLPDMFNYRHTSPYRLGHNIMRPSWRFEREQQSFETGLPDLARTLDSDPSVRVLALHGYYDLLTPFHQTELDLARAGLSDRVPVEVYEGGHLFFHDDKGRAQASKRLDAFYDGPNPTRSPVVLN
ncbi:S10 family serine carboxypeptidase-like protein [Phyllobacterium lublinensis]|uniref:S10 family serine carboxypeptidase-like protein n=1 Tax=Phyllobacterium lublinensis TaxID=2875708 RepID=UPI001CCED38A|nr:hypothetical protein [Phyllobacterium sp. 2063]MBZ9653380.1 hypothetical protein [Phyllobacterium sp. 2063]